jgi:cation diffusion facilitator family transporter
VSTPSTEDHRHPDSAGHGHGHGHETSTGIFARLRSGLAHIVTPHTHDPADAVDDAARASSEGIRAVKISLAVLGVTAFAQLAVVLLTVSVALLADTIHNFSDALTAIPLWIAFVIGRRGPTRRYTYGFGRAEDLAGLFVVAMIALSAVVAGYESVRRLIDPVPIENVGVVLVAGVLGFIGNELVALYRIRVGRRIGSAALVADGLHARTDGFTSLAVVVGALGVMAGFPLADPIVGLVITVAIVVVLCGAARDIYRRLMDAVDPEVVDQAREVLRGVEGIEDVGRVRMRWLGHTLHAEADIKVAGDLAVVDAHDIAHHGERHLQREVRRLGSATVHVHPGTEGSDDGRTVRPA